GCILILALLSACHASKTVLTYVNQKNPAETLKLERQTSFYDSLYNRFHSEMQLTGGSFTLQTTSGTTRGAFQASFRSNKTNKFAFIFTPENGKQWGVEASGENSFNDDHGEWKLDKVD